MARIQIPLDALTSRLNFGDRFSGLTSGSFGSRFANLRPFSDFFDFKRLSKPENFGEMQSRVNYNLGHFSSNYAAVFAMLSIYALLSNPLLLFVIFFVVIGLWVIGKLDGRDLEIGTFRATTSQLYTGILVVAIPLGLWASPFATLLWLIGASGAVVLGHAALMDKPIDEAFSGEADEYDDGRVVEELDDDDDDDTDSQGVNGPGGGIVARRKSNKRFSSDSLRFTGIDVGGGRGTRSRTGYNYQSDDDDDDDDTSEDSEDSEEEELRAQEDALVKSAMARIQRAQSRGRQDVKLSKDELKALDRRRKRMEAAKTPRKTNRVSIPLAQLDPAAYMSMPALPSSSKESLPRQMSRQSLQQLPPPIPQDSPGERPVYPPMGYFPPPQPPSSGQRNRPRSSSTMSQMAAHHGSSPFQFSYVHPPNTRHASDTTARAAARAPSRPASMRGPPQPEDSWTPTSSQSSSTSSTRPALDPFQYQTGGTRAQGYMAPQGGLAAAAARRQSSTPTDSPYHAQGQRRSVAAAPRGLPAREEEEDEETSEEETSEEGSDDDDDDEEEEEEEEETSDERRLPAGVPINGRQHSSDREIIIVEERERARGRKPPSPAQRSPPVPARQPVQTVQPPKPSKGGRRRRKCA